MNWLKKTDVMPFVRSHNADFQNCVFEDSSNSVKSAVKTDTDHCWLREFRVNVQ